MKALRLAPLAAAFVLMSAALYSQASNNFQAEGTNGDFVLRTSVNGWSARLARQAALPGRSLHHRLLFAGWTRKRRGDDLGADIGPNSVNWELFGVVGLGPAAVIIVDGFVAVPDQLNFVIPPSSLWNSGLYVPAPDVGLWLQSARRF